MSTLNWKNLDDLARDTMRLAPALRDVDAIIGIPRSGMIPAAILATALHKPLGMACGDAAVFSAGERLAYDPAEIKVVAIVDDSVLTGSAMGSAVESLALWDFDRKAGNPVEWKTSCVYIQPGAEEHVDHYAMHLPAPRVFEWNLFGHELIRHSMLDIDGVLCPDPPMPEDDREAYEDYIASATLLHRPLHPVAALATNRIQKYRGITEAWLAENGIEYGALYMAPFDTPQARRRMSTPADLKSAWYAGYDAPGVFIESHDWIARPLAHNTGRPVISMESRACFQ